MNVTGFQAPSGDCKGRGPGSILARWERGSFQRVGEKWGLRGTSNQLVLREGRGLREGRPLLVRSAHGGTRWQGCATRWPDQGQRARG